jgi:pimeloyl-ACP methyl ester carboxylesterase
MECALSWLRVAQALEDQYEVIMPDARAHGGSDRPPVALTPELLADDALALLDALKLDRPILMGRSNGAVTAVMVAEARPGLPRALLLEEPPMGGMPRPNVRPAPQMAGNWFEEWLQWLQSLHRLPHTERVMAVAARWPHGTPVLADEPIWPEAEFVPWVEGLARFDTTVFQRQIGYWSLLPYLAQIDQIPCPILLLAGNPEHGSLAPEDEAETFEIAARQGTVVRFEQAGHLISRGRTFDAFMAVVKSFLAGSLDSHQ